MLLASGLDRSIQSFFDTEHIHYASQILAYVGDLRRLKSEWKSHVKDTFDKGESIIAGFAKGTLEEIARNLKLSSVRAKLEELESITNTDEPEEGDNLLATFVLDDVLAMRDRIHLVMSELAKVNVPPLPTLSDELAIFDERARNNEFVRWGSPSVSGHSILYEPSALAGLWWWQPSTSSAMLRVQGAGETPCCVNHSTEADCADWRAGL